ncbi:type III secretion system effector protein OrgC family protein [Providencia alcalifaciens RIMD 1656011]|nr:type III secretion system effector protein OrgC family protein [Providencia alcalifaciens RIMD 1656011]
MEDPANGNKVFETFEKQKKALQSALESVDHNSMMGESIMAVLLGVTNAESQMTKWMQDIVLSGGEIKEFEEW